MLYSGIDLHKDNCVITTINQNGVMIKQEKLANHNTSIISHFEQMGKSHKAVVESTSNWYWLSDLLKDNGIEIILAHAKYLKAISYAKVKTDKVDSLTLAELLRTGMIPEVHQISIAKRSLRDLLRFRLNLVSKRTSCYNSVHRLLEKFNIMLPENSKLSNKGSLKNLDDHFLEDESRLHLQMLKEQVALLDGQVKRVEAALHPRLNSNAEIQRLLWVPGIGRTLAFTIYLETDGIERFENVNRYYSYCRLVPGASNSNRSQRHKSGNKDGSRYLKMAYMEAGVRAKQYYKEIRQYYNSKLRKSNKHIARAVVAKELASICYYVLKEKVDFDNRFKGKQLSRQKKTQWPRLASSVA